MDAGAVLIVLVVVAFLPMTFMMLGGIVSALIGWTSKTYAERTNEGSDFIDCNY